jgi:DNA-binding transcriptional ArsR family regulator
MQSNINNVNSLYRALANEVRRSILLNLADGDLSLSFLAGLYDMSLQGITKHLKILEQEKLVISYHVGHKAMYHLPSKLILKLIEDITIWYTDAKSA